MNSRSRWPVLAWCILVAIALAIAARTHYTADLSAFLPRAPTATQRLLVAQLKDGLASRLLLVAIEGGTPAERAGISVGMASALRADSRFAAIQNGDGSTNPRDQEYVFAHRYLLSDRITSGAFAGDSLRERIESSTAQLASGMGILAADLYARDPTGETLHIVDELVPDEAPNAVGGVWASRDGQEALLVAETRAAGGDTDAQAAAIDALRGAFERSASGTACSLLLSGPPLFAVEARATIQREAVRLSVISSILIIVFLGLIYRSVAALLLGLVPVVSGALAGVAAVSLAFGTVHGATMGFGVTLIGEAVDYSIYLFLQGGARAGTSDNPASDWCADFWPTIRLGMLTSVAGFCCLVPSSFPGLAQLGCYTVAGLLAAGLTTRYVLVGFTPKRLSPVAVHRLGHGFEALCERLRPHRAWLMVVPAIAACVVAWRGEAIWGRELSALSPVPATALARDATLRSELGAADAGTFVVAEGASSEEALEGAELAGSVLDQLIGAGALGGYESPARYLPSARKQEARRSALPPRSELEPAFTRTGQRLGLRTDAFSGFLDDVESARHAGFVTTRDLDGTSFGTITRALLVEEGGRHAALLALHGVKRADGSAPIDVPRLRDSLARADHPGARLTVLEVKRETDAMYSTYLRESIRLSLLGLAAIVVLLVATLRSPVRVVRVLVPLLLADLAVFSGFAALGTQLSLLHLVGLLLVVAIGSNYALLIDASPAGAGQGTRTLSSLVVANIATVLGFGVLSLSSVPILRDIGATVAPGVALALVFAAMLARRGDRAS